MKTRGGKKSGGGGRRKRRVGVTAMRECVQTKRGTCQFMRKKTAKAVRKGQKRGGGGPVTIEGDFPVGQGGDGIAISHRRDEKRNAEPFNPVHNDRYVRHKEKRKKTFFGGRRGFESPSMGRALSEPNAKEIKKNVIRDYQDLQGV